MMLTDVFDKGGVVVWVLLGYSVLALAIILERLMQFLFMGRMPADFEQRLPEVLASGELGEWLTRLKGPETVILQGTLAAAASGVRDLTRVAQRIGSQELQRMERGFRTLGILGNTAPLLGLLGTIIGMIKAFMVIEQAGGRVDAQALAGGIWEAMLTTGVGLAVAIPVLLILHLLEGMADRRARSMRSCASLLLEQLPHACDNEEADAIHHREGSVYAV
ncbi:MAG: MotA/TolQ/ExbB proton channel family protein [Gammaproteobacteria bacterium]|nr:MotA/TolQ/ExbB proton channel family protein [Gammaproteobacteria bacterium]MCW8927210.1 MotA/TolQ/ExbB proton channel family protein [Gammaproteobacteria bacterium]MCW8973065.1 MotA/TolQ/ExbB proton channel family protein [Gammaproteobacteria bacterium]MCW8993517.1 MotA/TolQ/ExbB proton channel family protein [Gammaproteobacteria bacterium]MCW9089049.1 MotA/TolQ/ExbB proton channel family protein [Gammaproteobacteria bacterium]